ncbi:MAG: MoxR family ATPase [Trueperaceae bacterium]|nr:MAG: MoxR family ATPase [Trueperaceae bacterium]
MSTDAYGTLQQTDAIGSSAMESVKAELVGLHRARTAVNAIVIGQESVVDQVFIALLCGGHVLLESAPGLGKTLLVRTLGSVCGMGFSRIQFTPDLMPADITGTYTLVSGPSGSAQTTFQQGPIFAQMVLADEINRATPKTQSALLEAMQEGTVTVAGVEYELPVPFFVLATQNPIEMEGTYVLPEAQVDRFFFKITFPFPGVDVLEAILDSTTGSANARAEHALEPEAIVRLQGMVREVPIASALRHSIAHFVRATQPDLPDAHADVRRYVRFGVSPRGAQTLVLAAKAHALLEGRFNVSAEDIRAVALPTFRHRLQLNFEGESAGIDLEALMIKLLDTALRKVR